MTPIPSGTTPSLPADLLAALEATGPRPALVWHGVEGRTELSGHVLANWMAKATNHLADEIMLSGGDALVLDLPEHWKRLVLALAGWSLGASVTTTPGADAAGQVVVATEAPEGRAAASADELLVLEAVALSLRAPGPLPPLAHDWAQEVRGAGDALAVPVGPWSGPLPRQPRGGTEVSEPGPGEGAGAILLADDGVADPDEGARMIAAWLRGGAVVGPARSVDATARRAEGVTPG